MQACKKGQIRLPELQIWIRKYIARIKNPISIDGSIRKKNYHHHLNSKEKSQCHFILSSSSKKEIPVDPIEFQGENQSRSFKKYPIQSKPMSQEKNRQQIAMKNSKARIKSHRKSKSHPRMTEGSCESNQQSPNATDSQNLQTMYTINSFNPGSTILHINAPNVPINSEF